MALLRGPMVLAADLAPADQPWEGDAPALVGSDLLAAVTPVSLEQAVFKTTGVGRPDDLTFKPFYAQWERRSAVYFNRYDEVLQVSNVKRAGVADRAGRIGLPENAPPSTVNVDCSRHFETIRRPGDDPLAEASWSHGWYFTDQNFYSDFAETLRGAVDRVVIAGRSPLTACS